MTNHQVEELALHEEEAIRYEAEAKRAGLAARRAERLLALANGDASGFCHCNGFFRGSDHCQCCGCEEFESVCDLVCDGIGCSTEHDGRGRVL